MDVVQIHSIIVRRLKSWSGASNADPRESDGNCGLPAGKER